MRAISLVKKPLIFIPLLIVTISMSVFAFVDIVNRHKAPILPDEIADRGHFEGNLYTNNYLGWQFVIPNQFDTISDQTRHRNVSKVAKDNNMIFDTNGTIRLLGIKKKNNKSSTLTSSLDIRSFFPDLKNIDDWFRGTKKLIDKKIENSGAVVNMTRNKIKIDQATFDVADFSYSKNNAVIYHQKMFVMFSKEYALTITIGAENSTDFATLINGLKKSKFKKMNN